VAPHNYYSHLASFTSAALCAVLPNVRIMEIDVDDVPWKDTLTTVVPEIKDGYMTIPTGPGWGADINEEVARAHPWNPARVGYAKSTPPPRSF
jgi:galactonate dehydratase